MRISLYVKKLSCDNEYMSLLISGNPGISDAFLSGVDNRSDPLVSADSTVTDDIPEGVVVAGNPAHPIDAV
jgi:hypothetical protein